MIMGIKIYWSPVDAVVASLVATLGVVLVHLAHPDLHPLAYAAGWLLAAAAIYQTGSELTHREKRK